MYSTPKWFGVLAVLLMVDAVPHRGYSPVRSRGATRASSWNKIQRTSQPRDTPSQAAQKATLNDKIVAEKSSTERGSNNRQLMGPLIDRVYAPRLWRPKTITKKVTKRPRFIRKYPSILMNLQSNIMNAPQCHMPWINELSKIQFYYDGINAVCDIAMTFEPCSTPGSVCRRYPVEFTCCPSTSLAVLEKCYKGNPPPENICLPTTIQMSRMPTRSKLGRRPMVSRTRIERVVPQQQQQQQQQQQSVMRPSIAGCSPECSPAWVNLFSNIKPVQNESLPVCEFLDVFQPCAISGSLCTSDPVDSTCCPLKCIPEMEKCYVESPPEFLCTPRSLQPWIRRIRKYFAG